MYGRGRGWSDCHKPRDAWGCRKREVTRKHPPQETSEGARLCQHPWFRTSAFENPERINFCCCRPPNLWHFAISAPGNQYPRCPS